MRSPVSSRLRGRCRRGAHWSEPLPNRRVRGERRPYRGRGGGRTGAPGGRARWRLGRDNGHALSRRARKRRGSWPTRRLLVQLRNLAVESSRNGLLRGGPQGRRNRQLEPGLLLVRGERGGAPAARPRRRPGGEPTGRERGRLRGLLRNKPPGRRARRRGNEHLPD